ncbi:hypothetical protein [Cohnella sp. 56]
MLLAFVSLIVLFPICISIFRGKKIIMALFVAAMIVPFYTTEVARFQIR